MLLPRSVLMLGLAPYVAMNNLVSWTTSMLIQLRETHELEPNWEGKFAPKHVRIHMLVEIVVVVVVVVLVVVVLVVVVHVKVLVFDMEHHNSMCMRQTFNSSIL